MRNKLELSYDVLYNYYITKDMKAEDIGKIYNRTKPIIHALLNKFDLIKYKKSLIEEKLSKDVLYKMYVKENLSLNEMSKILDAGVRQIQLRLKKYNITAKEKEEYRDSLVSINELQHDLLIGSFIGDGSFKKISKSTNFMIFHQEKQKQYCYEKFKVMKNLCTKDELSFSDRQNEKDDPNGNRQNQFYFYTRYLKCLNKYSSMTISEAIDNLNANSLAILFMDDGSTEWDRYSDGSGKAMIAMNRFIKEELDKMILKMESEFGLKAKIKWKNKNKGIYSGIKFSVEDTHHLSNIIINSDFGYIAEETMQYKICKYRDMKDYNGNIPKSSRTGVRGVCHHTNNSWRVTHRGIHVGVYLDFEDAVKAKEEAQKLDPIKYI